MSKKNDFIVEMSEILKDYNWKNENAKSYWETFSVVEEVEKPLFTDNGKMVMKYMQEHREETSNMFKSKNMAEELLVSSRVVSGSMTKLKNDGFVEKISQDPVVYALTDKGINIIIED